MSSASTPVATQLVETGDVITHEDDHKENTKDAGTDDANCVSKTSVVAASVLAEHSQYTENQYNSLREKADRYLLPLMWLCYGIQQTDKTSLGTQATFGLQDDTHLVGNQYAWLTTVFYVTYMCFEFPSNIILQRYKMGRTLSLYMLCWGVVVLCIGFAQNFTQLVTLRALQGLFECCISPGFVLVIGSWYTTREHSSRALVFQSANAGFGIISSLILYGIGTVQGKRGSDFQAWRYMSYFLGPLTILTGGICLLLLGSPSEVRWLSLNEKTIANTRILENGTGYDRTGVKSWKWEQARECLVDPCVGASNFSLLINLTRFQFWFAGINAFLASVPNGGLSAFGSILNVSFGFTALQVILLEIPRSVFSVVYFAVVGIVTTKWSNLRLNFMIFSTIAPFAGFFVMAFLPNDGHYKWVKWGGYFMTVPFAICIFLAWTLIPSNTAGRTKRTLTSSFTFVGYCVGNMTGSQIFKAADAPRYVSGTVACGVCSGLECLLLISWRLVYLYRNRRRQVIWEQEDIMEDERVARSRELGEQDMTDFQNPYFIYTM